MDQITTIAVYAVAVVVCGVASSRLVTGRPLQWDDMMKTEIKIFALTAILVTALYAGAAYMMGDGNGKKSKM